MNTNAAISVERGSQAPKNSTVALGIEDKQIDDDQVWGALDDATEQGVIDAINGLKGERTIIMIAHRLTTVRDCDVLYRMANGEIEAAGTYEEVIHGTPLEPSVATANT